MKKIKTIQERKPEDFDDAVNAALNDGWKLKWSKVTSDLIGALYLARMEKCEKSCEDCRFLGKLLIEEPCIDCGADFSKWEPEEEEEEESDHGQM